MGTFVIATVAPDLHSLIVAEALQAIGERCVRWITSDLCAQHVSIDFGGASRMEISGREIDYALQLIDADSVLWNRRIAHSVAVTAELCPADVIVAERENAAFLANIASLLNLAPRRVNDVYSAIRADNKALQLVCARRCGLRVPATNITNSPAAIRQFLNQHATEGVIAKPFSPTVWTGGDADYVSRSARVSIEALPSDNVLQSCPMIFQEEVPKAFEVRITCFATTLVAVKLDSQLHEASKIDWRGISPTRLNLELIAIPERVHEGCIALLRSLDLQFGCIDMIVTPANEWLFLEVNQMGQFLWIEEVNNTIPMLDLFVQLLTGTLNGETVTRKFGLDFEALNARARARQATELKWRAPSLSSNRVEENKS